MQRKHVIFLSCTGSSPPNIQRVSQIRGHLMFGCSKENPGGEVYKSEHRRIRRDFFPQIILIQFEEECFLRL